MNTGEAPAQEPERFEPNPGALVAEKLQLIREIGRGGMASVWLAKHLGLDGMVAVKFIDESFAHATARARFEREARAAARLRSPHVVQVFDYGVWQGTPYIAMEYLEGEDLGARLKAVGRLSATETVSVVSQVARALMKAHNEGIVHRDLKPANVFLVSDIDRELCKVLDFGIAKTPEPRPDGTLQGSGQAVGTPEYMSPEQASAADVIDWRSDLWSLAVIAFRCLTGTNPFETGSITGTLLRVVHDPIPAPTEIGPALPAAIDAWWRKASERRPEARFQTAKALAQALAEALGVPVDSVLRDSSAQLPQEPRPEPPPESTQLGHAATISTGGTPRMPVEAAAVTAEAAGTPAPPPAPTPASLLQNLGATLRNRRTVALVAAGGVLLVVVGLLLFRGGSAPTATANKPAAAPSTTPEPQPAERAPTPRTVESPAAAAPSQPAATQASPGASAGSTPSASRDVERPSATAPIQPTPARTRKPTKRPGGPRGPNDKYEFGF